MASESEEVDPRNTELLDWLWNIPEPPVAQDLAAPSDLTARLRWPEAQERAAAGAEEQPTTAVDPVAPAGAAAASDPYRQPVPGSGAAGVPPSGPGEHRPAGFDYDAALAPIFAGQVPRERHPWKRLLAATAVLLVVLAGVGVGYKLFGSTASPKPANITFGGVTTDSSTTVASVAAPVFGDTTTSGPSTTTTTPPPTTTPGPTVPAAVAATTSSTTTTTSRSTTTVARATTTTTLPVIVATVPPGTTTIPAITFPTSTTTPRTTTTTHPSTTTTTTPTGSIP